MPSRTPIGADFRILTVVGARPQFVKAAAVSRAIAERRDLSEAIVHTGQHFDANMSEVFFRELDLPPPAYRLDINGGGHGEMTGRMMIALEQVMLTEQPNIVLLYGDTNSTLAGALCAAKLRIPIAHVEAGVRSFDQGMPEEINRILVDRISSLLFTPTTAGARNLANEGLTQGVYQVGDVNYDATLLLRQAPPRSSSIVADLGLGPGGYAVATLHRAASVDAPDQLAAIMAYLREQTKAEPIVMPVHPRTRKALEQGRVSTRGLVVIDPLGPIDMHRLLQGCTTVYTDSGGLQKEAYFQRKPCVTLRDETEWTETVEAGWNRLWRGPDYAPRREIADYGDGASAPKMLEIIHGFLADRRNSSAR